MFTCLTLSRTRLETSSLKFYLKLRWLYRCFLIIKLFGVEILILIYSAGSVLINQFMCKYDLEAVKSKTLGFGSYVDYFIPNKILVCNILDFDIIDCGSNLADRNSVILEVSRDILKLKNYVCNKTINPPYWFIILWDVIMQKLISTVKERLLTLLLLLIC